MKDWLLLPKTLRAQVPAIEVQRRAMVAQSYWKLPCSCHLQVLNIPRRHLRGGHAHKFLDLCVSSLPMTQLTLPRDYAQVPVDALSSIADRRRLDSEHRLLKIREAGILARCIFG